MFRNIALYVLGFGLGISHADEGRVLRDPKEFKLEAADRDYWAFRPVTKPSPPPGTSAHPIDRFLDRRLQEQGLTTTAEATPDVLIRRLYFGLIGLPPSVDDVRSFVGDHSPDRYERVVDTLLGSPRYGERWGRHWLDVVRFAQTNGYERDDEKPYAWRYRDYVIDAFNEDKPYHRFIKEQIAGDELDDAGREGLIATGFFRLGVWDDEPDDKRQAEMDELDDMVKVTSETFLGLTIGCARCHHHMFDPVSQEDYYQMLAFFRNARPYARPAYGPDSPTYSPIAAPEKVRAWRDRWQRKREAYNALPKEEAKKRKEYEKQFRELSSKPSFDGAYALALRESGPEPRPTFVMLRGDAGTPGHEVEPAIPEVFGTSSLSIVIPEAKQSSGRRLSLAEWIAGDEHPLTARVLVNRVWKHHFGKGLVQTANDFGQGGMPPSHPELLDWLAGDFVSHGWSIKRLHRLILTSAAYKRSSEANEECQSKDPGNVWLWRQNLRRLEAEVIRDRVLAASGTLNHVMAGRGFFPNVASEVFSGASRPGRGWGVSTPEEASRRSVYAFVKRTMMVPFLEAFDYSNTEGSVGVRPSTTVPTQALMMLNSEFVSEQAARLAQGVLRKTNGDPESDAVTRAFEAVLARRPNPDELRLGTSFLREQTQKHLHRAHRIRFRPEVPEALDRLFLKAFPAERSLVGPSSGWSYSKGRWGGGYENIMVMEPTQGPFALLEREWQADDQFSGRLHLKENVATVGLLWASSLDSGVELLIDRPQLSLTLRRFKESDVEVIETRSVSEIPSQGAFDVGNGSIQWGGERFELPRVRGRFGIRVWGDVVVMDDVKIAMANGDSLVLNEEGLHLAEPDSEPLAKKRALQEFCALLFNLNEFVHVD